MTDNPAMEYKLLYKTNDGSTVFYKQKLTDIAFQSIPGLAGNWSELKSKIVDEFLNGLNRNDVVFDPEGAPIFANDKDTVIKEIEALELPPE
jgi:hypothetical protein